MIENKTSSTKPDVVTVVYNKFRQATHVIAFDIVYNEQTKEWSYKEETIPAGRFNYGGIVDILIQDVYPVPNMQAVQNNYLKDMQNPDYKAEMDTMQEWRDKAKEIARTVLEQ